MNLLSRKFTLLRNVALGLGLCLFGGYSGVTVSQTTNTYYTTDLSTTPPDLTVGVAPNIAVTFDDSGSMGSTNLPDTLDGSSGKQYYYSSTSNSVYYNPTITYTPPLKADGVTSFPNASYTAAWLDGICANTTGTVVNANNGSSTNTSCLKTVNLSNAFTTTSFIAMTTSNVQAYEGGGKDGTISPAVAGSQNGGFYYTCPTLNSESGCVITKMSGATSAQQQNFANWYSYYRTRNLMTRSSIGNVFASLGSTIRVVYQNLNKANYVLSGGKTTFNAFADTSPGVGPRTNFFKWLYAVNASGGTPTRTAIKAAGDVFMYGANAPKSTTNPYFEPNIGPDGTGLELTCRMNYSLLVTDGYWNGSDPYNSTNPLPSVRTGLTLPDGTAYGGAAGGDAESKIFWNVPATSYSTLSDIAFYYWATNLRPDFVDAKGKPKLGVPPSFTDYTDSKGNSVAWNGSGTPPRAIYFNPKNDPATWPHVVQYMIALGINGTLAYDGDYAALRAGTKSWPTPASSQYGDATDIDDTWHTAINSRGQYFSARDPATLSTALSQLLARIISRTSSSVAGALNTGVLTASSVTFTTGYDSASWTGSLLAKAVDATGSIGATLWDGSALLTTRNKAGDDRVILTSSAVGAGKGIAFTYAAAGAAINAVDSTFGTGTAGQNKLAYLRGATGMEGTTFRTRVSALGAIINSQPVYVAYPASGYRDSWPNVGTNTAPEMAVDPATSKLKYSYEQFVADHQNRAPTLYVGANDGMLHAFDATTSATDPTTVDVTPNPGRERWAYVPYTVFGALSGMTVKSGFTFQPTVDATPVSRDVFFSGATGTGWHSILVGGLRLGGRGIYALDITNAPATEATASSKVLWEFNSNSVDTSGTNVGANLGYTFGKPNVGRLANGKWVVIVPSGYFPTGSKVAAASNNFSSLFVLDAQTGAVIKEIKTPTTVAGVSGTVVSYGLGPAVLGDYNNDQVDDVAFAGDLQGNLWRFDLSDASPANWKATLAFRPSSPGDRPITAMPRLFADPTSSYFMVVFGTGKYLGATDNTVTDANNKVQGIYGIRDRGPSDTSPVIEGSSKLVTQTMVEVSNVRGLTTNPVPATLNGVKVYGWVINLTVGSPQTNKGERVVVDATALFDSGRAIITTLIPGSTDPCNPVRLGAVLVIDAATGGASSGINAGSVTMTSGYTVAGARVQNVPASGGLPAATVLGGGQVVLPGISLLSDGTPLGIGDAIWRRRSWRVLNNGN
ncbi:type IV pilus assembly protein PilY1 [Luteibacter sp. Sphag1AF]|uniref:pilus assembly protein n=1 Tax=Luteibacter sp. Sphag1AF TaxID=2587031 RepID=UPI00161D1AFE|nr:PilC/PilY family type IV pilus protein [Luteibacter sp. Sphag1AF]MBB3229130.1 type IV pilus assembly protein PilY1 [Luteibacter sp. Sphag1AF]